MKPESFEALFDHYVDSGYKNLKNLSQNHDRAITTGVRQNAIARKPACRRQGAQGHKVQVEFLPLCVLGGLA